MGGTARLLPLGTGGVTMPEARSAAAYLFEVGGESLMLDCGPGALLRLAQAGRRPWRIGRLLLTHFHLDHHLDLLALAFQRRNPAIRDEKVQLEVLGPPGLRAKWALFREAYGGWIDDPDLELDEWEFGRRDFGPFRLELRPAAHAQPACCVRVEAGGRALAYSGDSGPSQALVEVCRGAALAVVECSFPDGLAEEGHMTPADLRALLAEAAPERLGLTHLYPEMARELARCGLEALFPGAGGRVFVLEDLVEVPC